jgi:hypothetical protein
MLDAKPPAIEPPTKRQQTLDGEWAPETTTTKKLNSSKKSNSGTQPTLRFGQTTNPNKAASIEKPSKHRKRVVIQDNDDDDSDNE